MKRRMYYKELTGYEKATEHQKEYIGKDTFYDLDLIKQEPMRQEIEDFIRYRAEMKCYNKVVTGVANKI